MRCGPSFRVARAAILPLKARAAEARAVRRTDMAFNDLEKNRVEKEVAAFVEKRRPPRHMRDEVDLGFRFDGTTVELFEVRARWDTPNEKIEERVAKARYVQSRDAWLVYWQRADLKWHRYDAQPEVKTLEAFLALVDEDAYGCFFG